MKLRSFLSTVCLVTSLLGCGPSQSTVEPTPPTATDGESTKPSEPTVEIPDGCQVLLLLEAEGADGRLAGPVTLHARAKNLTNAPLELTLADRCPGGEARFSGLEPADGHYDYYGTCAMGACPGGRPPLVIPLPPGEIVTISSANIGPDGEQPCNQPIAAGTYTLSFSLDPAEGSRNPAWCGPEPLVLRRE